MGARRFRAADPASADLPATVAGRFPGGTVGLLLPEGPGVPELPEVEILRRQLAPAVTGAHIAAVDSDDHHRFAEARTTAGRCIEQLVRRGKYLLLTLDDGREAVVHLGMTGQLSLAAAGDPDPRHLRVRLTLVGDAAAAAVELRLADARKFGRFTLVSAGDYATMPTLAKLGPDPLTDRFTVGQLADALAVRHTAVKAVLLEQRAVAGVGNWIADEVLFAAGVDPARHASALTGAELEALHAAVGKVIAAALAAGGTSFSDYVHADGATAGSNVDNLVCYGRAGLPCVRCGTELSATRVAGRGTTVCRSCQR